jgi:hypothetical protein
LLVRQIERVIADLAPLQDDATAVLARHDRIDGIQRSLVVNAIHGRHEDP